MRAGRLPRMPAVALPQRLGVPASPSLPTVSGTLQIRLFAAPPTPEPPPGPAQIPEPVPLPDPLPAPTPVPPPAEPLTGMPPGVVAPDPADSPLLNQNPAALGSSGAPPPLPPTMFHVPEPSAAPVPGRPDDRLGAVPTGRPPVNPPEPVRPACPLPPPTPTESAGPLTPEADPEPSPWLSQKPPAFGSRGVPPPLPPTMFHVLVSGAPGEPDPLTGLTPPSTAWAPPPA